MVLASQCIHHSDYASGVILESFCFLATGFFVSELAFSNISIGIALIINDMREILMPGSTCGPHNSVYYFRTRASYISTSESESFKLWNVNFL